MNSLYTKRIYLPKDESDGMRILVDRLWPRGVRKEHAGIDVWLKDIAPSPDLRTWFCHKPELFPEFSERYRFELRTDPVHQQAVQQVLNWLKSSPVTLVYAAADQLHNHTIPLRDHLVDMQS